MRVVISCSSFIHKFIMSQFVCCHCVVLSSRHVVFVLCISCEHHMSQVQSLSNVLLLSHFVCFVVLGERFRIKVQLPEWTSDEDVAIFLFKNCILVHLTRNVDKFNLLVYAVPSFPVISLLSYL